MTALRSNPKRATVLGIGAVVVLAALSWAWANRGSETWVTVAPTEMHLTVGQSQPFTVSLMYKPPFRGQGSARPIGGTVQLASFPEAVDVTPTSTVTSDSLPQTTLTVTGLKAGQEELTIAVSNRPTDEQSWRTALATVVVTR